ncbi:hypothetical protein JZ751_008655 [Albula glossodonta]|uniref:ADAMTS-like protein 1 n=1 Tax=Albula glossodonta TaxID=121402 RepID=A0A8T2P2D6_9TELE|nr:hypothetical protein JZ751_008655 [Albula glossodonta]
MEHPASATLLLLAAAILLSSRTARSEEDRDTLWDAWGSWSECSRTCGGGASYSLRRCLSSKTCEGQNIKYRTCSNVDCPPESGDFRAQQCSAHVDVRYQGQYHEWLPVDNDPENPCALKCKAKGSGLVVELAPKVLDGTRCYTESLDMCISGACQIVGCDHELGSTAKEDNCGVCNGDGSSCRLVRGHYKSQLSTGKTEDTVIVIPYGSRHVRLVLKGPDHLYLESKTLQGVKGESSLSGSGTHHLENTTVDFQKFPDKEVLRITGPLGADFTVKIHYAGGADSVVQFIFYQPIIHRWRETDFFPCSVTCGGGYQLTSAECFDLRSNRVVVDQYCHYYPENVKPKPKLQECNMDPCPASDGYKQIMPYDLYHPLPRWESSPWTACSTSCGGGIQSRSVSCVEEDIQGTITPTEEWKCLYSPKTPILQACNTFDCPTWLAQEWSPCTVTCGQGLRYRVVLCIDYRGLHAGGCNPKTKPHIKEECLVTVPCYKPIEALPVEAKPPWSKQAQELDEPTFIPGPWSPCSRTCGAGTQRRTVKCQVLLSFSQTVDDLPDDECEGAKPPESQPCYRSPCKGEAEEEEPEEEAQPVQREELHDWEYEGFTECSQTCGGGVQEAVVICLNKQTQDPSEESLCVSSRRPPQLLRACNIESCPPRWETGAWSSCSATCGVGLMSRSVACTLLQSRDTNQTITMSDGKCRHPKPSPVQACNRFDCPPMWELRDWGQCSRSCGGGTQKREVLCKQRLADGSILELPDTFCPSPTPPSLQSCDKKECPPKWVPMEWSQCSATCGEGAQRLALVCRKQEENGEHQTLSPAACAHLPQPATVRACSLGPCARTLKPGGTKLGPSILAQRKVYIQWRKEKKLQFIMGGYAYLLPRTSVFIRCPVRRFRKGQIQWLKDGKPLLSQPHLVVTPLGYVKIQHLRASDAGVYTCAAGPARENFVLKVIGSKRKLAVPDGSLWLTNGDGKPSPEALSLQDRAQALQFSFSQYDSIVQRLLELKGSAREGPDSRELLDSAEKNVSTLEEDGIGEAPVPLTLVTETWRLDEVIRNLSLQPGEGKTPHGDQILAQLLVELTKNHGESNESTLHHPSRPTTESSSHGSVAHKPKASQDASRPGGSTGQQKEHSRAPAIIQKTTSRDKERPPSEVVAYVGRPVLLPKQASSVELKCEAVGSPEPVITWSKDGIELLYNSRVGMLPGGSLRILAPREADAGLYTCTARNRVGSTSLSSTLKISEPPQPAPDDPLWFALVHAAEPGVHSLLMSNNDSRTTLQTGAAALIGCLVKGHPRPQVSWFLNRQPLSKTSGVPYQLLAENQVLRILNVTRTLRGEVSCWAENEAGTLQQRKILDVQVTGVKATSLRCLDGMGGNHSLCQDKSNATQRTAACQGQHCPPRWLASPWSSCSVSCGGGVQWRRVYCQQGTVEEESCTGAGKKPPDTQLCNTLPCVEWAMSAWGLCHGHCVGPRLATQHRQMFCQDRNGTRVPKTECSALPRPTSYRNCSTEACALQWRVGPWTQCTSTCGSHGFQSRHVACAHQRSGKTAREINCAWRPRPSSWQRCNIVPCARGECRDSTRYCEKVRQLELCSLAQFKARCCESCRDT